MTNTLQGIYRGFSTKAWVDGKKTFAITDIDCVREDLLNHIYTRLGQRGHMPSFGTRIPDQAFEPNDQATVDVIKEDINKVIAYDPRVEANSIDVYSVPNQNAIVAIVNVTYNEFFVTEDLNIQIASDQQPI